MFYARFSFIFVLLSFLFAPAALAQEVVLFEENFDEVTEPTLPPGWVVTEGEWETSSSSNDSESGINNLEVGGGDPAVIRTPTFDLTHAESATLAYSARRTSEFTGSNFQVVARLESNPGIEIIVVDVESGTPVDVGSYQPIEGALPPEVLGKPDVYLSFELLADETGYGNFRIDDVQVTGAWTGGSRFGYAEAASAHLEDADGLDVPVRLIYAEEEELQGLEWTLSWDPARVTVDGVSLDPELPEGWELQAEQGAGSGKILLYNPNDGLPMGDYPALFTLQLSPILQEGTNSGSTVLGISNVINAQANPSATSADIEVFEASHTILFERQYAEPGQTAYTLDLGAMLVGDVQTGSITVANVGTIPLTVEQVGGEASAFAVSPESFSVPREDEALLEISHAPTFTDFGFVSETLHFAHNGESEETISIVVTATGVGGRGDASQDGLADVMDLILVVDYILERVQPDAARMASVDLHPFSTGNDVVDVRDLVVLAQAILAGAWPDAIALPARPPAPDASPSLMAASQTSSDVEVKVDHGGLRLKTNVPLRALQLEFDVSSAVDPVALAPEGWTVSAYVDEDEGILRVLVYSLNGEVLTSGEYALLQVNAPVTPRFGVAMGDEHQRLPVEFTSNASVDTAPQTVPSHFAVEPPYPNPLSAGKQLNIPVAMPEAADVEVVIFDILGRRVLTLNAGRRAAGMRELTWSGRTSSARVAPGVYLLRVSAGEHSAVRTLVIR